MKQTDWDNLIKDLRNVDISETKLRKALKTLKNKTDKDDVPRLYKLLHDKEAFIREIAAVPLSRLEGVKILPKLLRAMIKGINESEDNDGLQATLNPMLREYPEEAKKEIAKLAKGDKTEKKVGTWAQGFIPK